LSGKLNKRRGPIRIGLAFQASQPFSYYVKCAKLAQKFGFEMFQVYDDLMFKPAWPVLFSVAPYLSSASTMELGPGVVNPFHSHPSLIATNLACLSEETGGRSFIVIGRGAFHEFVGIRPEKPIEAVKETVEIVHDMLSGKWVDHDGRVFKATREARFRWTFKKGRRPRIWIGTWGKKLAEMSGRMSQVDGIMISSITEPSYVRMIRERVTQGAESVGRDPSKIEVGVVIGTTVSGDRGKSFELARTAGAVYLPYLSPMTEFVGTPQSELDGVREALSKGDLALASSLVSTSSVNAFKMWGTPDDIIEKTERLFDKGHGITTINYGFGRGSEDFEGIELLGKKVLPYFRKKE
jgi:5,10-methylenetetrahydromethanopterin reductase